MAVKSSTQLQTELQASGERLKRVREAAAKERERRQEAEPTPIPTAQTPLVGAR